MKANKHRIQPKVALIGPIAPPNGGMAVQGKLLLEHLQQDGVSVQYVAVNPALKPQWLQQVRFVRAILRLALYIIRLNSITREYKILHVLANSGWSWYLYGIPAIMIGKARQCKVIVNYRGGSAESFFARHSGFALSMLKKADQIIVPSGFLKEVFSKFNIQANIIPNIVNFPKQCPIKQRGLKNQFNIVVTRNLEKIYDIETILHAFFIVLKSVPNAHLYIAGTGPEQSHLEYIVKQYEITEKVTFCGRLNRTQIEALYQTADLMLNASIIDNMPNALLEAQAHGIPVVSTNSGGISHIVSHLKNALLVPTKSPEKMAEQVMYLIKNPAVREELVRNGLENINNYGWDRVGSQWIALYQGI